MDKMRTTHLLVPNYALVYLGAMKVDKLGVGIAFGIAIGAAFGVGMDEIALGVGFGVAIGIAIGIALSGGDRKQSQDHRDNRDGP